MYEVEIFKVCRPIIWIDTLLSLVQIQVRLENYIRVQVQCETYF